MPLDRPISWPADLPIIERREEIAAAIGGHQVVVVCGETGSGKSTQLPKICLDIGRGERGLIGHTQPRRIAARSIAARVAEELGTALGGAVGYKVRFGDRTGPGASIQVMTDGILLAETQGDRHLRRYDTIIIDEAHERSLNVDFLLGYLKRLLPRRRDLKLVITSATIDPQRFSDHFDGAPVIEVSGRTHPVEIRYRPLGSDDPEERDRDLPRAILAAVDEAAAEGPGDVLVFLAGEREIRETAEALRKHHPPSTEILPLYARLSPAEQHRVFEPHAGRRIVLATNVAETSLTVPGIRVVIDPGLARISRYSPRSRVQRLPVEPISRASAKQRAGRCGRLGPGLCIRLYDERDLRGRDEYTLPEILRTNLASVVLRMAALRLGDPASFPFIDPPTRRMIRDGHDTLRELGALDERDRLTETGRRLAGLPVDPRLGRMVLAAGDEECLDEVLVIAAALAVQDPRVRPHDEAEKADEAHRRLAHEDSDFLSYLNIWEFFHEQKRHLSWSRLRLCCRENYLSFVRLREWHDVHGQLRALAGTGGRRRGGEAAPYERIHQALLTGLLSNVALRGEGTEYAAAHGGTAFIFPGSTLFRKPPKWIMAAEIVETTRRYARCVARIQPEWIERAGTHLLRRSWSEPHWDAKGRNVIAFERATLYGLEVVSRRRVPYGPVDPAASREIFIHHALVEGEYETGAPFLAHNLALVEEIRDVEAKRRRRDVLVDQAVQHDFYDRRLPADVWSGARFERWRSEAEAREPGLLFMGREDLVREGAEPADVARFPDALEIGSLRLPLEYVLDPGHEADGVTVTVPPELLARLTPAALSWLVPGMLEEKIIALIRSLPAGLRRLFAPAPDHARACLERLRPGEGALAEALAEALARISGVEVPPRSFDVEALPAHLRMNVRVRGPGGEVLAEGRDLARLQGALGEAVRDSFERLGEDGLSRDGLVDWDFGELPASVELESGGGGLAGYPALLDRGATVSLRVLETPEASRAASRAGLRRLFALRCRDDLELHLAHLPGLDAMRRHWAARGAAPGAAPPLESGLAALVVERAFLPEDRPGAADVRTREAFERRLDEGRARLWDAAGEVAALLEKILEAEHEARILLESSGKPVWAAAVEDARRHLDDLMPPEFLERTPWAHLRHCPRYLAAVTRRLERLRGSDPAQDRSKADRLAAWRQRCAEHEARYGRGPGLDEFRWLLEEMRVSLFAQDLGTAEPVSEKRLAERWEQIA